MVYLRYINICCQGRRRVNKVERSILILVVIMVLTQEELDHWNMDMLKNCLNERGISLSGGGSKKADLIRKVLAADLLKENKNLS